MAAAAYDVASKRSWFGAMEQLVDGYRDLTAARDARLAQHEKDELALSRTSTIEFDVVCDDRAEKVDGETAQSTGASTPQRRRRLLRLDGVFKRSGRRFQDGSVSLAPLKWLAPKPAVVATNGGIVLTASKGDDGASSKLMGASVSRAFLRIEVLTRSFRSPPLRGRRLLLPPLRCRQLDGAARGTCLYPRLSLHCLVICLHFRLFRR